ncbi:MltA domain-containing protein [Paraburkholderia fungorum]|uniref:MltA domain-containing protein n=1 Tax=Paraburkholderia fungorum TaxID=134537 RepID=UPI0038BC30B8
MQRVPLLLLALTATLAGCASNNPATSVTLGDRRPAVAPPAEPTAQAAPPAAQVAMPTQGMPAPPASAPQTVGPGVMPAATPPAGSGAATGSNSPRPKPVTGAGFATRHAYYESTAFADLPGWDTDDVSASWDAFRRSCTVLGARSGWSEPCNAARAIDVRNVAAIRQFFETYFNAYQIRNTDKSLDGTMTGYYEPLLNGSRQYGGAYRYPVYGTPNDMLYLDARRLPDRARGSITAARIDGRSVIPLTDVTSGGLKGVYALDLRDSVPDIRDKKIRLRLDGERIVPYYTRAEIERGALKAPILAYVDDPVMLYSMQLQGAGKVRMSDGSIRRFAYAEQNGRPFLPPLAHNGNTTAGARKLVVRGMEMQVDVSDDDAPAAIADSNAPHADGDDDEPASPLLRGFKLATTTPSTAGSITPAVTSTAGAGGTGDATTAGARSTGAGTVAASSSGDAAIAAARSTGAGTAAARSTGAAAAAARSTGDAAATGARAPGAAAPRPVFAISDPSYVFFRVIPDSPNGPLGALGVPLSAGRSVAVDPRTTPLGAPVFVSTRDNPQTPGAINRLMLAQDSGGAIQGAVRADYFYGFGQSAQTQASRTKERLRMWVLLPKGLHIAAQETSLKTRGVGPAASDTDCLVSDPVLCVDDAP